MARHARPEGPSQVRFPWRAVTRSVFQAGVGIAAAMPVIVESSGLSSTAWGVGTAIGVSAAVTRIMAVPAVNLALAQWAPWLAAEPRQ
ncbi:hypothetical protein ATM97_07155 [Nocardia sp. MH4]|nr:hypothetical protein [Nocardia sp. MH4]